MENNEKFDFVAEKLEQQKEPLPVSLEKENVVSMLKSVDSGERKNAKIVPIRRYASIAAALVIIVSALIFVGNFEKFKSETSTDNANTEAETYPVNEAEIANEYQWVENYFLEQHANEVKQREEDADMLESSDDFAYSTAYSSKSKSSFGETNVQSESVDEGDIVKNDGRYIFIATSNLIRVVDTNTMSTASVITDFINSDESEETRTIHEIYVSNDTLTVISSEYPRIQVQTADDMIICGLYDGLNNENTLTRITSYDISDRTQPRKLSTHTQSGDYNTSRAVDGMLYTVTYYCVDVSYSKTDDEIKEKCVPKVDGKKIPASEIFADDDSGVTYVVISSFSVGGAGTSDSYAYLGHCGEIYSTADTMYIFANHNAQNDKGKLCFYTDITSISMKNGLIAPKAKGRVDGSMYDRFSADEYNGNLRLVTTLSNVIGGQSNSTVNLYVLDENLEEVGTLIDIQQDEQVKSVRFIGDAAYIVTFEETDPLTVVDLSDPTAPKIMGEVELPGFSNYLHPTQDGYIVGIGYGGDDEGADMSELKITLFDVTDPKNPKVADEILIENADTDVNYDPKALLYDSERQLIFLPATVYDSQYKSHCSLRVIKAADGNLSEKATFDHQFNKYSADTAELFRGTYISNTAYTITEKGVCAFDIDSAQLINKLKF